MRKAVLFAILATAAACAAPADNSTPDTANAPAANAMSFFITSVGSGDGANLGGLAGADRHCASLAQAAGSSKTQWRAYLSAAPDGATPAVNARDRIGAGPWYNADGALVASNLADLHGEALNLQKATALSERGAIVNGRGDTPNRHDILTGSQANGTLPAGDGDRTCRNWTSNAADGSAWVGHHDRQGGGSAPTSWNAAHPSRGCGQANLEATGGAGLFYCFAVD